MNLPVAHYDLAPDDYPFTIEVTDTRDDSVVWSRVVVAPGPVHIPNLARRIGAPVRVRILFADGRIA